MNLPGGDEFYLAPEDAPECIAQGDIFLCPSGALLSAERRQVPPGVPPTPRIEDVGLPFLVRAWDPPPGDESGSAPAAVHEGRWGPVMVISHECDLQKDFNALARLLVRTKGLSTEEAEARLAARDDLDRYAVVAPLFTYGELRDTWAKELRTDQRIEDVRRGLRVDFFPLPAYPNGFLPESVVSFLRFAMVERRLLTPDCWIASLQEPARGVLRYKLGTVFASRDISVVAELEAAIGQRIADIVVTPIPPRKGEKKAMSMVIHVESGDVLHLQGAPIRPELPDGPSRAIAVRE